MQSRMCILSPWIRSLRFCDCRAIREACFPAVREVTRRCCRWKPWTSTDFEGPLCFLDEPVRRSITKGFIRKNDNHARDERERGKEGGGRRQLELEVCCRQEYNVRHKNQPTAGLGQEQDHPYGLSYCRTVVYAKERKGGSAVSMYH